MIKLSKIVLSKNNNPTAFYYLGTYLYLLGNYEESIRNQRLGLKYNPFIYKNYTGIFFSQYKTVEYDVNIKAWSKTFRFGEMNNFSNDKQAMFYY